MGGVAIGNATILIDDGRISAVERRNVELPADVDVLDFGEATIMPGRTIRTNFGVLRAILAWAVQDDLIVRSPCRGIRLPEVSKAPMRTASAEDKGARRPGSQSSFGAP